MSLHFFVNKIRNFLRRIWTYFWLCPYSSICKKPDEKTGVIHYQPGGFACNNLGQNCNRCKDFDFIKNGNQKLKDLGVYGN